MVNPRQKGIRGEQQVIAILDRETKEKWEQTPGSGSGKIKGDLRVNGKHNIFCVEVKFYKHVGFDSKIYTQKSNNLFKWWSKICKQAQQMKQELRQKRNERIQKNRVCILWRSGYLRYDYMAKRTLQCRNHYVYR